MPAADDKPPTADRPARAVRNPVAVGVGLYDGKRTMPGELRNISLGGAFVAIDPPVPLGVGLSFWLPLADGPVLLRGHVRWTRSLRGPKGEPVGVGIQFFEVDAATAGRLGGWVGSLGS